jgi:DNA-binding CsgD family transcriptional regulator
LIQSEVHILGPHKLQNALMASYLQSETGLPCFYSQDLDLASTLESGNRSVVLWDCIGTILEDLWTQMDTGFDPRNAESFVALFNAVLDRKAYRVHKEAVIRGIRGIFFEDDPPEVFSKGIVAILKGERWLSRNFLSKCVVETMDTMSTSEKIRPSLTTREKEILLLLASGASNEEIADHLCISYHTVKTHLTSIYKKIQAGNRLQATLWATKNL